MNIPPFISRTPPPIDDDDDDDYDDFGSFVHDTIEEDNGESERSTPIGPETLTFNNVIHSNSEIENNISGKLHKLNSIETENEAVVEPVSFELSENAANPGDNLEIVSFESVQPKLKCDFNCDSGANDLAISDSEIIGRVNGEETNPLEDHLTNHNDPNLETINSSPLNADESSSILCTGYEEESQCDNISEKAHETNSSPVTNLTHEEVLEPPNSFNRTVESESETVTFGDESIQLAESIEDFTAASAIPAAAVADDDDDDDFDDFADFQSSAISEPVATTSAPEQPKISLFEDSWSQDISDEAVEFSQHFDTNIVTENRVWQKLHYLEDTPALKYTWSSSTSNHKMLSALKIDSRNILCGPWSKSHKSLVSDGKNFEGLIPCDYGKQTCSAEAIPKASVPEAHFDWEGSGLTNPLFMVAKEENFLDIDLNNIISKKISPEAEEILQSLPNLSYMKKPYIVFNRSAS